MQANRSIPPSQVIPELGYPDVAGAAAWLCEAFGFRERLRIGNHRVQLVFGTGALVVAEAPPREPGAGAIGHGVLVRVEDVDAHCARARAAGATIVGEPQTHPYGERQYGAIDLAGHRWTFSQTLADVAPADWGGTFLDGEG
jgi:uncharacterized glyoxalase superfamily protein PhnB